MSFRDEFGQWDPKNQRPELWSIYNGRTRPGENIRVFPISNWTELDVWQYIRREQVPLPEIYFAHPRQVVRRGGALVPVTDVTPARNGDTVETLTVRFRTVGDITCTAPVESAAATLDDIVRETAQTRITEARAFVDAKDAPLLEFFDALYANAVPDDILRTDARRLAALARALWLEAGKRAKGAIRVATLDDGHETVLVGINDDRPFLFDSALQAAIAGGARVRAAIHPIVTIDGVRTSVIVLGQSGLKDGSLVRSVNLAPTAAAPVVAKPDDATAPATKAASESPKAEKI